jgi:hypothetical protein
MAINFSTLVYGPNFDMWARPIVVGPIASQPGRPAYTARAIYHSDQLDVPMEDGSMFSDQKTYIDVRESEFAVIPAQNDLIDIPLDPVSGSPAEGSFAVTDVFRNGGGETSLILRKLKIPAATVIP